MFADEAKTNGAGANGGEFPRNVLVLDDQFPEVDGRPIESLIMLLHAGVTKVVTGSARKRLQPHRLVKFEGSPATGGAQQAQALPVEGISFD
jgi:hypothetical protein